MLYINSIAAIRGPSDVSSLLDGQGCKSILQLPYLSETGNCNFALAREHQECTSSELAAKAAQLAVERSAFELNDISLIVADTTSPHELIPSEAQRTAKLLDHKVASYDIGTGGVGIPGLLAPLRSWKKERLEKPVLCVSVHAPTLSTTIEQQKKGPVFGDAAVAFVVSTDPAGFSVERVVMQQQSQENALVRVPMNGQLKVHPEYKEQTLRILSNLAEELAVSETSRILASTFGVDVGAEIASCYAEHGESFGAAPALVLESLLSELGTGEEIVILAPGCGVMSGACLLKKV